MKVCTLVPRKMPQSILVLTSTIVIGVLSISRAAAMETKVADPNTAFHRLYVTGSGEKPGDEDSFADDVGELRGDLEKPENQAAGSTSKTLNAPTRDELRAAIDKLKMDAMAGQEVTIVFVAHAINNEMDLGPGPDPNIKFGEGVDDEADDWDEAVVLNANQLLYDGDLATMLMGFHPEVTLVVIMDVCHGGGYADGTADIQESAHVAVIGTKTTCPMDPPGLSGGFTETLTEGVADGAGQREADANGDGKVTAAELKQWLMGEGWDLGSPDCRVAKVKKGKARCLEDGCMLPPPRLIPDRPSGSPGTSIYLQGQDFAGLATVQLSLVTPDLSLMAIGTTSTNSNGSFTTSFTIPPVQQGLYLVFGIDSQNNETWEVLEIFSVGTGATGSIPTVGGWGFVVLILLILVGGTIIMGRSRSQMT